MKLIIGLGNPGTEYDRTRHNVGFMAVDAFAEHAEAAWKADAKRKASVAKAGKTILAKPTTYMNNSGDAAAALISFYKVAPEDVLVVHDEMDLAPGRFKFTGEGGPAGHNGVEDIQTKLGTDKIARLRIGIGRPPADHGPRTTDYVLETLSPQDAPKPLDTASAMRDWIEGGLEKASNRWNRK
ncbi:aminoacyl-tRNA hydrolase [Candidatus Uhrbacteria bacterium RIFCSPHIGHO2_12_FULL_60_25]|uniref:Peptidyl-tRNA hydrolase n=1 Tax=Candidatus Uhrbacteria bacterium RIFCSPHIGHO2_12_FULL_60_25 TaxID=1802399 RepID=A0A1F7UM26_9BACT|nr:MAG: aminoacyl-tRNA hydrolase [Candidatus Uhrbacteria bacterium RIFCSPHIGHO2_02_FULL_60_44]OGL79330.1 MAG: aminoacyl-tRNA hydrolase [Candidatus Uhrbacteria bacterium RIFCSPHIGHO2_12_FULL_60_25]